ncbi:hypothetical protein UlMin_010420 [Ulmus minor]
MESNYEETNKSDRSEAEEQPSIPVKGLPRDISFDILSRLPITSLLQCKLVSHLWYSSVKHPLATSMHLSRANESNPFLLCFFDFPRSNIDIVCLSNLDNDNMLLASRLNFPSQLTDFDVVGSCNGLLCLYNLTYSYPLFIYNPFTREQRELPELNTQTHLSVFRVVFGFGFHPRTRQYKVINIVYYREGNNYFSGVIKEPEVYVLTLGNPEWKNLGKIPHQLTGPASEALVNGNLHWLTTSYLVGQDKRQDVISFDLATDEFHVIPQPSCWGTVSHLVALKGCLSAVVSCQGGINEIWVLKESWSKAVVIPSYVPQGFRIDSVPPARIRLNGTRIRAFSVLCTLKGGEILFSYRDRRLVSFNPDSREFKDLEIQGLPILFETTVHVGSLLPVDVAFNM